MKTLIFSILSCGLIILFLPLKVQSQKDSLYQVIHQVKDSVIVGEAYLLLGKQFIVEGDLDSAEMVLQSAKRIFSGHRNLVNAINADNSLGTLYGNKGNNREALKFYLSALESAEKIKSVRHLSEINKNIGALYNSWKKLDQALKYDSIALQYARQINDPILEADCYNNIGIVFEQKEEYETAIDLYNKAFAIYEKAGRKDKMAMALGNQAIVYKFQQNWPEALRSNFRGLQLARERKNLWTEAAILNNISSLYSEQKNYDSTIFYANLSIAAARKMDALEIIYNSYGNMAKAAQKNGLFKEANYFLEREAMVKDSFLNKENANTLATLEAKYQSAAKDRSLLQNEIILNRRKFQLWGLIGLLALLFVSGLSIYRRIKLKNQKRLHEEVLKQKELATINILQAEEKERNRIGADLHDGVGQLLTAAKMNLEAYLTGNNNVLDSPKILEKTHSLLTEGVNEVRQVSHSLMPVSLNSLGLIGAIKHFTSKLPNEGLNVYVHSSGLDDSLEKNKEFMIFRIVQECFNNILKHSKATVVHVNIDKDEEKLLLMVEDNGIGFDVQSAENGIGLSNIRSRVNYLKGELEVDSKPGNGTVITIQLPV